MSNRSNEVRDLLDVVVRDDADTVRFDAQRAWREGRRRGLTDGLGVVAAVVVLIGVGLALMSLVVGTTPPLSPASGSEEVATSYPQRLDYAYWDDKQPRITGPLAGVVQRNDDDASGWYAVSPEGHLWRLDMESDHEPALSPDGSHLGYMPGSDVDADYVIANQLDGTSVSFPQIGTGAEGSATPHRYFHSTQSPAFWSPDGDELLLRISSTERVDPGSDPAAAVLGIDGSFTTIPTLPGRGRGGANPVGWIDEDHVALVAGLDSISRVRVWIVDIRTGRAVRTFFLENGAAHYEGTSQWFGRISADGNELATGTTYPSEETRLYSMRSDPPGALSATLPSVASADWACSPSWTSADLYVPTRSSSFDPGRDDAAILVRANGGVTIVADPRLNIGCSTWARTALEGPPHEGWGGRLFGKRSNWLAWHWREVSLSVLLVLGLFAVALLAKRRYWRIRPERR